MTEKSVTVVGAGLAGSEAAWQLAKRGIRVKLIEMKPEKKTPAHVSADFAELVCSNSFRSDELTNAVGLLKEELRRMDSLIMRCADAHRVPAGGALAVDRTAYAAMVTACIEAEPNIEIEHREVTEIPEGEVIIASGPLTSDALSDAIARRCPESDLHFFDAAAPIVTFDSIDMSSAFFASRYDKGTPDYVNCPMTKEEYLAFWQALVSAEQAPVHGFDDSGVFEGCMPVEVMARRGEETLRYGPMKPVGLIDPRTGEENYAVVQLRKDNAEGTLYNIVGFQTHLTWPEQRRVFSMIPALAHAEFTRYGVMHRNTFINSPLVLRPTMQLMDDPRIFFAGQMTGVEGYVESAAAGLMAGVNAARLVAGQEPLAFPPETAHGSLARYITSADPAHFQPMNVNFGLMPPLAERVRDKKLKKTKIAERALSALDLFKEKLK